MASVQMPDVFNDGSTSSGAATEAPSPSDKAIRSAAFLAAVSRFWGLGGRTEATPFRITSGMILSVTGGVAAVALLSFLVALQIAAIFRSAYYGPFSLIEESAYTYTSSQNYLRFGYMNSGLLQDFCNSADARDHPIVYDHMPPGPDLLVALLLQATGESYRAVRIILAVCFVVGIYFYLRFCQIILSRLSLRGSGFILLLIGPWPLIQGVERLIYNLYPFLAFAPFVFLHKFYETGKKRHLIVASTIAFLSSIYLEYSLLSAVLASWFACYLTGLIRIERRHLFLMFTCIVSGIALHLLQNMLYLGPQVFFQELTMTLGNRIMGSPTQQELAEFYRTLGMVHHGSQPPRGHVLWTVICANFRLPMGWKPFLIAAVLGFLFCLRIRAYQADGWSITLSERGRRALRFFFSMLVATLIIILTPIFLFPAFAQEVNLHGSGANYYYLAIGFYGVAAFALRQALHRFPVRIGTGAGKGLTVNLRHSFHLMRALPNLLQRRSNASSAKARDPRAAGAALARMTAGVFRLVLVVAMIVVAIGLVKTTYAFEKDQVRYTLGRWREDPYADLLDLKDFANELYITNINTPAVGFFTNSPGYGVCGPETISADGRIDRSKCKISFMRRTGVYERQEPRYFFFFWAKEMFPGFADLLPSDALIGEERGGDVLIKRMQDRLDEHFTLVHQNRLFRVYDLHQRKTPRMVEPEAGEWLCDR